MANRLRASKRQNIQGVPEAEAELVCSNTHWPVHLADAACNWPGDSVDRIDGPAVTTSVEAVYSTKTNWGGRHDNEDRSVIASDVVDSCALKFYMIGVLDGHDTAVASDMVSRELPPTLAQKLKEGTYPVDEAYITTMAEIEERLKRNTHASAGTCVLNCTVAGRFVWCANLGDCRAALISLEPVLTDQIVSKKALAPKVTHLTWLSRDHKASAPSERQRIRAAGGEVMDGRVEGLEPSRTLGDFDVKVQVKKGVISIVPEVRLHAVGDGTDVAQAILVCATDGVWDALSGQDICGLISARKELAQLQAAVVAGIQCGERPALATRKEMPRDQETEEVLSVLAEDIVHFSVAKGSRDDCTVTVALISVAPA
mmetsp:Transcript_46130/g.128303  ORF Transcript_46130/g.128303 Transcript_46130/m.128303 type:complete len:371 (+) Transcript_46130:130-1242(+)